MREGVDPGGAGSTPKLSVGQPAESRRDCAVLASTDSGYRLMKSRNAAALLASLIRSQARCSSLEGPGGEGRRSGSSAATALPSGAFRVVLAAFPDSAAAKGMQGRAEPEAPTSEQIAFASLMRGVHW